MLMNFLNVVRFDNLRNFNDNLIFLNITNYEYVTQGPECKSEDRFVKLNQTN